MAEKVKCRNSSPSGRSGYFLFRRGPIKEKEIPPFGSRRAAGSVRVSGQGEAEVGPARVRAARRRAREEWRITGREGRADVGTRETIWLTSALCPLAGKFTPVCTHEIKVNGWAAAVWSISLLITHPVIFQVSVTWGLPVNLLQNHNLIFIIFSALNFCWISLDRCTDNCNGET